MKNWTKYSVQKAKKIIAVSQNTKKDLEKLYAIAEDKIEVIYNGYQKEIRDPRSEIKISNFKFQISNYILYVGTLQPRKNVQTLIKTFFKFNNLHPEFRLIIAGKKGWMYDEIFTLVKKLDLSNKVQFVGYVTDQELTRLYKNAFCLIMPSLYEGFGIPILEAMSHDCPVISSNTSSLPEVGGDSCLYFDPTDENSLFQKMEELKNDAKLRSRLIEIGQEQVKKFSWEKCAKQTLDLLKEAG